MVILVSIVRIRYRKLINSRDKDNIKIICIQEIYPILIWIAYRKIVKVRKFLVKSYPNREVVNRMTYHWYRLRKLNIKELLISRGYKYNLNKNKFLVYSITVHIIDKADHWRKNNIEDRMILIFFCIFLEYLIGYRWHFIGRLSLIKTIKIYMNDIFANCLNIIYCTNNKIRNLKNMGNFLSTLSVPSSKIQSSQTWC